MLLMIVELPITLDSPEDSDHAMKTYGRRIEAKPGWSFLRGNVAEINNLRRRRPQCSSLSLAEDVTWIEIHGMISTVRPRRSNALLRRRDRHRLTAPF